MGQHIPSPSWRSLSLSRADGGSPSTREIPSVVYIRFLMKYTITKREIHVHTEWAKEIIGRTWTGDLSVPREFIAPSDRQGLKLTTPLELLTVLAHVSASSVKRPCTECTQKCSLRRCKINSVWPPSGACTCCAFEKKEDKCSFNKGMFKASVTLVFI